MSIHKEGRKLLFYLLIILFLINAGAQYAGTSEFIMNIILGVSIILYLLVLQFFRNPKIIVEANEKLVYAPADGKVVVIEKTREKEYFHDERIQISIFMSPLNVHVNRTPITGLVKYFKYHPGKYLVAWHPKSSTENERTTMVLERGSIQILVRQVAGAVARRIKWYVKEGQQVAQGQEFGFIKFGSRLDVYLPVDAEINASINQVARAGKTVLATLK
jgi:phosphatidylserine decarboxylase